MRLALPLLLVALGVTSCASAPPVAADNEGSLRAPDIRGKLTTRTRSEILVEENPGQSTGFKMMVRIADDTIVETSDGKVRSLSDHDIGRSVAVWISGPVTQSYPNRGTAQRVRIERYQQLSAPKFTD